MVLTESVRPGSMSPPSTSPTVGLYRSSLHGAVRSGIIHALVKVCLREVKQILSSCGLPTTVGHDYLLLWGMIRNTEVNYL